MSQPTSTTDITKAVEAFDHVRAVVHQRLLEIAAAAREGDPNVEGMCDETARHIVRGLLSLVSSSYFTADALAELRLGATPGATN